MAELDVTQMRLDIDAIQAKEPFYTLGLGEEIPAGADLNDYKTIGNYRIESNANAQRISNYPYPDAAFAGRLVVRYDCNDMTPSWGQLTQEYTDNLGRVYYRVYGKSSSTWTDWVCTGGINSIVAEGISGVWRYVKYANGVAEAWANVSLGSLTFAYWVSPIGHASVSISLPSGVFSTVATVLATVSGSHWGMVSTTAFGATYANLKIYKANATTEDFVVSVRATGRWK